MSEFNQINEDELKKLKERLGAIREVALDYLDKNPEDINPEDIKDLESMQKQSEEIRKIASKIPLLGDICLIAADLSVLLKRAILLMLENMKPKEKPVEEKLYINKEGIKQSDNMSKIMEVTNKKLEAVEQGLVQEKDSRSKSKNKLVARSEYFGYEASEKEKREQEKKSKPDLQEEKMAKERLEKYNKEVKARGEANQKQESSEKSETGPSQSESQPSKD